MELWSLQEAARRTKTSVSFWRKQVRLRRIPVVKVGRLTRLDPDHIREYLAAHTRPAGEGLK
jgi:excisionase family DNA binding protein